MSAAQDLHDKIKALVEEYRGTPGLTWPLTALEGILGHLRPVIRKEANAPKAEEPAPVAPPAKPAPVVQVAKPQAPSS